MLKLLTVRNFAVIDSIRVEFKNGLNLLTGETGSGKSIIVDALGLLLGDRSSVSQIRTGEKSAFVEGIFELSKSEAEKVSPILADAGIGDQNENEIIIRREVASGGKARIVINDRTVGVSILRNLQPLLIEIHGQGDQKLLRSARAQLDLLDAYAESQALRKKVSAAFSLFKSCSSALDELRQEAAERERARELMQHQLAEIDALSMRDGEDEELARQKLVMANAERIISSCGSAYDELYESDKSVLSRIGGMTRRIQELSGLDARLEAILSNLEEGAVLLSEAADLLRAYVDGIDFSQAEFVNVDNRLSEIEEIKRKFGTDLKGILGIRETLMQRLEFIERFSEEEARLASQVESARKDYVEKATKLSSRRKTAAGRLECDVAKELPQVALDNANLSITVESLLNTTPPVTRKVGMSGVTSDPAAMPCSDPTRLGQILDDFFTPFGTDQISLMFSANPGEELRPLSQVASGGELSRLMLALLTSSLKNVSGNTDNGTVIFDEIDSGIGGRVSEAVGRRLKSLAKSSQVLCVTHQASIARFADAHFLVQKKIVKGRTVTSVELLAHEERVREVARMIAGDQEARTTIETAQWMLENAETAGSS